jgi:AraC-like DNA-binding protein
MGISYSDYLLNLRLANAEQLLIKSDSKIIEIALASGFNSISYFNREFLKKNGVSPGEFRKSRNLSGSK